jgi:hypothetical protein
MLRPVWNPFSSYADRLEKRIDGMLKRVAFLGVFEAQRKTLELMQENLVILDLWLEAKFKGYKYLKKSTRKKMYRNAERIGQVFMQFAAGIKVDQAAIDGNLRTLGLARPTALPDQERLLFLIAIMMFLKPSAGRFQYLEGASFGKLLSDPDRQQKMIGDCNQIVTFYCYLYSLKFELKELQIKILPGHVCLHFKGIDIEATAGAFANYQEYTSILPVVELISTNLLDVSDFRDKQIGVNPREFLKAAQLAGNLSSDQAMTGKNLRTAYYNVALDAMKDNDFDTAVFFLEKTGLGSQEEQKFLADIFHNAVIYQVKQRNYSKARFYAAKSSESDLKKYIDENEALHLFESGSLNRARELFQQAGNQQMVKACYGKEYNQIQARVAGLKDLATMRSHRSDYQKMLELAGKMEDSALAEKLRNLLSQL